MKGIIMAGGLGTRLYPTTLATSKQLIPVYDKPMIYYPLSVLMLADIRDILIITRPEDLESFQHLLGNGSHYGLAISYEQQKQPKGIAEAFTIAKGFIGKDAVCLILGDNIFFGQNFSNILQNTLQIHEKQSDLATIFAYPVSDPRPFGAVDFDHKLRIKSVEEKPIKNTARYKHAITGLYFYGNDVLSIAESCLKGSLDEWGITTLNQYYLEQKKLNLYLLGRGFTWLDSGTPDSLLEASQFVQAIEHRQGLKIACLEEIALSKHWIDEQGLQKRIDLLGNNNDYSKYLSSLLN